MRREDVVELIRCEMPDLTDGPFDVRIEHDCGGAHICVYVEFHEDAQNILESFHKSEARRLIVKKVPEGWLESLVKPRKD
tara:strand:+ start:35 stop:274 length:240 start_codon:yes stop_codon:yes gene_type:complete